MEIACEFTRQYNICDVMKQSPWIYRTEYKTEYDVPVIIDINEISFDHGAVNSMFVLVFLFLISEYIMIMLKIDANRAKDETEIKYIGGPVDIVEF